MDYHACTFGEGRPDSKRPLWAKIEAQVAARQKQKRRELIEARKRRRRGAEVKAEREHYKAAVVEAPKPPVPVYLPAFVPPGERILRETAKKFGFSRALLLSQKRSRPLVRARFELCWRLYCETQLSLKAIGTILDRDHTTILNAVRMFAERNGGLTTPAHRRVNVA